RLREQGRPVVELRFGDRDHGSFATAWRELIERGAGAEPAVVVADDCQDCDEGTAALLAGLAASKRAQLLAARRSGEPVPVSLLPFLRDPSVLRLDPAPLAAAEVEVIAGAVLHGTVTSLAVRA